MPRHTGVEQVLAAVIINNANYDYIHAHQETTVASCLFVKH